VVKKNNERLMRWVKLLWLPALLIVLLIADSYFGISKSSYALPFLGVQILLFVVYTYFLFKDRPQYVAPKDRVLKGKRKIKKN
jgi:hypothetical protein